MKGYERTMSTATKQKKKKRRLTMAETADKFKCYELSVQCPENEVEFFEQAYRDAYGAKPLTLREDFCGCLLYTSPSPRDQRGSRMPSSA